MDGILEGTTESTFKGISNGSIENISGEISYGIKNNTSYRTTESINIENTFKEISYGTWDRYRKEYLTAKRY